MSCKDNFSLFDFAVNNNTVYPPMPINDELMSFVSEQEQTSMETNFDILLNKHLNNLEITDIELQQLPQHQRNALYQIQNKGKDKKKRPDQSQKLFYKRAFKFSQSKFFKRCKNKSRKMSHFYHFHFDCVSQAEGIPITQFYHPNKKTKPGLAIGHKTFNSKYVRLLLKSKSFLEDTREYHKIFIEDCLKDRRKKVISFTNSIQRILKRAEQDSRILVKHLQSAQCKIPWTFNEIKETWEFAQRDLIEIDQLDEKVETMKQVEGEVSLGQDELGFQ